MRIFIGCSSNEDINNIYIKESNKLSKYLAKNNNSLILGGINGLMGIFCSTFIKSNLDITIFCVKDYYDNIDKKYKREVYKTVNARKKAIINKADIFIFLPGGIGTLDELFTIIEAKRSGEHNKNIIILNINNYYDNLIVMLDNMYKEKFIDKKDKFNYIIKNDVKEVIDYIERMDKNE